MTNYTALENHALLEGIARDGFAAHETQLKAVAQAALEAGASGVLIDAALDTSLAQVVRLRALARICTVIDTHEFQAPMVPAGAEDLFEDSVIDAQRLATISTTP